MRWFRKNNKKMMAVVVIVLMFVFVGSSYLSRMSQARSSGRDKVAAYHGQNYGDRKKVTNYDLAVARQELEVLRMLGVEVLFRPRDLRYMPTQDFRVVLLGELLFSDQQNAVFTSSIINQIVRRDKFRISDKQIDDIYRKAMPTEVYWLLLKDEAQRSGITIPTDESRSQLADIIPQLSRGATYSDVMSSIMDWQGISEEQILDSFAALVAISEYAKLTCSGENFTDNELRKRSSWRQETMDVEYVRFLASDWTEEIDEPGEEQIGEHFEKYKESSPGRISEENPYGFGYKLPARAQLEYVAVTLDDVAEKVDETTQEEAEEYYQRQQARFTEQVPSDPNDPNSLPEERVRPFAEVADMIMAELLHRRVDEQAGRMLADARELTEAGLSEAYSPEGQPTDEQLKELAGDYGQAAKQTSEKYAVPVYSGSTGWLSATNMQGDEQLGMLYVTRGNVGGTGLVQLVFAVDELGTSELGPFDSPKPRMYENIAPVRDMREAMEGYQGKAMMLIRVIGAKPQAVPDSLDESYSTETIRLGEQAGEDEQEMIYSVREHVLEDLKKLAAMEVVKAKAQELVELATEQGWETAVAGFNELYAQLADDETEQAERFSIEQRTGLQRISPVALLTLDVRNEGNPAGGLMTKQATVESELLEQLYSLIPADSNAIAEPLVVESRAAMACYSVKSLSVNRLYEQQYHSGKAMEAYRASFGEAQVLAVQHYNPQNILKRSGFRLAQAEQSTVPEPVPEEASLPIEPNDLAESQEM